jgi:peptide/nickel transport system permease protein
MHGAEENRAMKQERLKRLVPAVRPARGGWAGALGAAFFYGYAAVLLARLPRWIDLVRSPSASDAGEAAAAALGLGLFYAAAVYPALIEGRSSGKAFADRSRRFFANRAAAAGLVVLLIIAALSLLAPLVAPADPAAHAGAGVERYQPPSPPHPFGTDKFGRDILSRVVYGARVSLGIAVSAVMLASLLGTIIGAASAYAGGRVDDAVMRAVDGFLSFPRLLLLLTLVAFFANSIWLVVAVLAATGWMGFARLVRAEVLVLKEREFVQAAVAGGAGRARIVLRHLVPNTLGTVVVAATLRFAAVVLLESYLSFLGLGVQPPTPSWGSMVFDGREVLVAAWWVSAFPGLAIVATVVSCNLVGDGLRDALDVRMG